MLSECVFHFQLNFEESEGHDNGFWDGDDDVSFEVTIFKLIIY